MDIAAPFHAAAPLWADKDMVQKQVALAHMAVDLAAHAERLGQHDVVPADPPLIAFLDTHRTALLARLESLLTVERHALREDLRAAIPADAAEARDIAEIARLLDVHPDFLTVGCEVGHVTGSALIVDAEEGAVLLHRHRKLNRWFQFGGHPDYELNMLDVALREAREESGIEELTLLTRFERTRTPIDVDLQSIPASPTRPAHVHADLRYVFTASRLTPVVRNSEESADFWILKFDDALRQNDEVIEPSVRRLIAKAKLLVERHRAHLEEVR